MVLDACPIAPCVAFARAESDTADAFHFGPKNPVNLKQPSATVLDQIKERTTGNCVQESKSDSVDPTTAAHRFG